MLFQIIQVFDLFSNKTIINNKTGKNFIIKTKIIPKFNYMDRLNVMIQWTLNLPTFSIMIRSTTDNRSKVRCKLCCQEMNIGECLMNISIFLTKQFHKLITYDASHEKLEYIYDKFYTVRSDIGADFPALGLVWYYTVGQISQL